MKSKINNNKIILFIKEGGVVVIFILDLFLVSIIFRLIECRKIS